MPPKEKRPLPPSSSEPKGKRGNRIEIDLLDSDDDDRLNKRECTKYVLAGLVPKLSDNAKKLLLYPEQTSRGGTINTVQLSDVYRIAIGSRINSGGQSKDTLNAMIQQIADEIRQVESTQTLAISQFEDAIKTRTRVDQVHDGTSKLLKKQAPRHTEYASVGLPAVTLNKVYKQKTNSPTLLQCLKYVSSTKDTRAVLFHGSTAACKEGICKLLPEIGPSQGVLHSVVHVYGPGLYMSPDFFVARDYACDRAKSRKEIEAIVIEIVIEEADKVTSNMFGGTCSDIIVIRSDALHVLKIRRIHHFPIKKGEWCPSN